MPSKFPYPKSTRFYFLCLLKIIGTLVSIYVDDNTDELFTIADVVLFSFLATFIVATVPALLIALWAKIYRYTRYNVVAIVLISLTICLLLLETSRVLFI